MESPLWWTAGILAFLWLWKLSRAIDRIDKAVERIDTNTTPDPPEDDA